MQRRREELQKQVMTGKHVSTLGRPGEDSECSVYQHLAVSQQQHGDRSSCEDAGEGELVSADIWSLLGLGLVALVT